MSDKPKYKNYKELANAFKTGELDSHYVLVLDKGGTCTYLSYRDDSLSDIDLEKKIEKASRLFDGDSREIEEVFEAAGIPVEWC